jgi:cobalt-zinc-cadmium resistance protein CzcA
MLNRIIAFSIKEKLIIGLLTLSLLVFGLYELTKLPIDAVPDITDNQVQIITSSPSFGAPDVERFITFPLEQACSNIPGLKNIRSFSRFGLSVVTIVFEDNIDVYWARQQVTERLQKAKEDIPKTFGIPEMAPVTTGLGEIYQYVVRPKKGYEGKYNLTELRTIQDWIIKRQLVGVKGVADVASFGGQLKQFVVAIDPAKLSANNTTIAEVFTALENNNQNTGGSYIEKGPTALFIRSEGLVSNLDEIKNIVVKNQKDGNPILIDNIAEVELGAATRFGAMTYNGEGEVAGAVVMMLKNANSNDVIVEVKKRITEIQKNLPEGILIDPYLDRTKMVNNSISTVTTNLIEGALIVIFILVLFLGNFRAGLLVASVIPLAMLFAVIMMNAFGVSGNLMSLGALDFGLIIDGAVIIVEAVMHRLSQFRNTAILTKDEMNVEVKKASGKMMNSAVFGQIIILIVYLPILTLEGIEGKMFKPMAQTVAFALLGALILSLTYIPMMSALLLSKKANNKKNISDRIMEKIENGYEIWLRKIIHYPKLVLTTVMILFISSIFILTRMGGEFIPSLPEGDFAVEVRVLPGSNLKTSTDALLKSQRILLAKFPEVEKTVGKTGSSEIPTDPMPIEGSDLMIILKDRSEWTSADNYNDLASLMENELKDNIPGVTYSFQYPVAMRFNELMTGAKQDVVCKIFGEDIDTLSLYAERLGDLAKQIEGSHNIYVEPIDGIPQIVINYNRAALAQYGVSISEINKVVNTAFAGQSAGNIYEGEKKFDLVVRLEGEKRNDLEDVSNLLCPTEKGEVIPLHMLAAVTLSDGINQIQRENAQRRIIVGFNVKNRDIQTTVNDLQKKADATIQLPAGYYIKYGGAFENLIAAKNRLAIAVPISLVLILVLLYFAFKSIKYGLLIFTAIPLSAIGGIYALLLRDMPFSISAGIGFIALFGVAVLNGIVLVAEFNRHKNDEQLSLKEIVIKGGKSRLRPVLMTACVASFGFLPMALSNGEGAEVQRPLATVVIGGLLLATLLTLFVLPLLYTLFEKIKANKKISISIPIVIVLSMMSFAAQGQTISLNDALDSAIKNNGILRSEQLNVDYLKHSEKASLNLPSTDFGMEYGKINSSYNDSRFYVSQSLQFPTVYKAQKQLALQHTQNAKIGYLLKENELKSDVRNTYFYLVNLLAKMELLNFADSIYTEYLIKVKLRLEAGETDWLEQTTAESQKSQIQMQLAAVLSQIEINQIKLSWLLNSAIKYWPETSTLEYNLELNNSIANNLDLKQLHQQYIINEKYLLIQKRQLYPSLSIGYSNMSMYGAGADNKQYGYDVRFGSANLGISVPIFAKSQLAMITAQKIKIEQSQMELENKNASLKFQLQELLSTKKQQIEQVNYYKSSGLKNADIVIKTADLQFRNGEINFLDWTILSNNALKIKSDYLEALNTLNQINIAIQSITNN